MCVFSFPCVCSRLICMQANMRRGRMNMALCPDVSPGNTRKYCTLDSEDQESQFPENTKRVGHV